MKGEPYYRKKKDKIVIEQKIDGKTKYLKTLPPAKTLLETGRLDAKGRIASQKEGQIKKKPNQKFGQSSLNEPSEDDIMKTLWEVSK